VNPFSIGVASGEAGVSIGDGLLLRLLIWLLLTTIAVLWVLRYAAKVRRDPAASLVGWDVDPLETDEEQAASEHLTRTQKWVLVITVAAFALMIFSVIPWSSILSASGGPANDYAHSTASTPYWFELNWWFPQLAMLFILAAVIVGVVARIGERETVRLISAGASDMIGPALVVLLAGGVSVIMTNTKTLDTILHSMEQLIHGSSAAFFAVATVAVNVPLAILVPSSSGHATLAMPLLAPLADFAHVSRATTVTAWILAHGVTLMFAPTSVVLVGGLAIARVGYDKYLKFAWPMLVAILVVGVAVIGIAATVG